MPHVTKLPESLGVVVSRHRLGEQLEGARIVPLARPTIVIDVAKVDGALRVAPLVCQRIAVLGAFVALRHDVAVVEPRTKHQRAATAVLVNAHVYARNQQLDEGLVAKVAGHLVTAAVYEVAEAVKVRGERQACQFNGQDADSRRAMHLLHAHGNVAQVLGLLAHVRATGIRRVTSQVHAPLLSHVAARGTPTYPAASSLRASAGDQPLHSQLGRPSMALRTSHDTAA